MRFQKAQAIVEFALILPLFLLFLVGIIYFGFAFSDYLLLSHTTRSITHEASLTRDETARRDIVKRQTKEVYLRSGLFIWEPKRDSGGNNEYLKVETVGNDVVVTANAPYDSNSYIGKLMKSFGSEESLKGLNITYTMYCPSNN